MTFQVAKVTKPLLSVGGVVSKGHTVVFGPEGSEIRLSTGGRIPLRQEGQVFMMDIDVVGPFNDDLAPVDDEETAAEAAGAGDPPAGFTRRAMRP
jgi:hypothetical protein